MKALKPDPLFGPLGHMAWGGDCPYCQRYWESIDTHKETPIKCDDCGEEFEVEYPG